MDCFILLTQNRVVSKKSRENIKQVMKLRKKIYSTMRRETKGTFDYSMKKESPTKEEGPKTDKPRRISANNMSSLHMRQPKKKYNEAVSLERALQAQNDDPVARD